MASDEEVIEVSPKGNSDDIVVVTVRHSWLYWLMVATSGIAGAFAGGLGVVWVQAAMAGTC